MKKRVDERVLGSARDLMYQCTDVPMYRYSDAAKDLMYQFTDVPMCRYSDAAKD